MKFDLRLLLVAVLVFLAVSPAAFAGSNTATPLHLGGIVFDPLQGEPALPEGWDRSAPTGPDLHLVQFDGAVPDEVLARMHDAGLEPVQYLHPNTYIVWGRRAAREGMAIAGGVRWTGDFAPAYRVQPRWRNLPADVVDVQVLMVRSAVTDAVVAGLESLGGSLRHRQLVHEDLEIAEFSIPGDTMQAAASIPGVYSIQVRADDGGLRAELTGQISAGNVDGVGVAIPGYQTWLTTVGVDGSGVVVALVDDGIDELHPEIANRMLPCSGSTCTTGRSFHGTHTAGTIAGDGSAGTLDPGGFLRGLGVAPGANVVEQYWRMTFNLPGGMATLIQESWRNGAVISNNSWGASSTARGYDADTLLVDAGVRDADPSTPGAQALVYVQAIANGNGGVSSQGTPDDGKNLFTIGSTPGSVDDGVPTPTPNNLSDNSGHGPALDGRTIPHMVAPGCYIDSTWIETQGEWGYNVLCGTSMAAAHVSGAIALFFEYYRNLAGTTDDPSPAMVKAAFMPVAHDLWGGVDADGATLDHRPDSKQGWGRVDTAAVVAPVEPVLYFDQTEIFDATGQQWSRVVTQANPAEPMRVMLVWTDAPGHGLGGDTAAWNNDLDLTVEADTLTYLGNDFGVDGFSTTGGVADNMNNAEGVVLPTVTGNATIRVSAVDINSNGVPFYGDKTDQDFALVCYNCVLVPDFAITIDRRELGVCAPGSASLDVRVDQLATFGDPVTLTAVDVPAGAIATFADNPLTPPASTSLTIDPGTAVDGDYSVTVQGDSATLTRTASVILSLRTAPPVPGNLLTPADLAIDVDPKVLLEWDAVTGADHYMVELALDPTFEPMLYSAFAKNPSHTPGLILDQLTTYYWRVRSTNACGYGTLSVVFSFTTADFPDVLLVDDDYDLPDFRSDYTDALDTLGVTYDIWDVWGDFPPENPFHAEPGPDTLALYDRVIWWSGREEVYSGPNSVSDRYVLPEWIDDSRCMMISAVDYILQRNSEITDFMSEYLGLGTFSEDTGQGEVTGAGTVFGGLGLYGLSNINPDYRDSVSPDATAELAFVGDVGDAGINKDGGAYRTAFLGFQPENAGAGITPILDTFLTWCDGLGAVDGDLDGVINSDDCAPGNANAWGTPQPITDLVLAKGEFGFLWSEPVSGAGSTYDVLRSSDPTDFLNATCVSAGGIDTFAATDPVEPAPGQLQFYLVGARSKCGVSTLGNNLDGTPRYGTTCEADYPWW